MQTHGLEETRNVLAPGEQRIVYSGPGIVNGYREQGLLLSRVLVRHGGCWSSCTTLIGRNLESRNGCKSRSRVHTRTHVPSHRQPNRVSALVRQWDACRFEAQRRTRAAIQCTDRRSTTYATQPASDPDCDSRWCCSWNLVLGISNHAPLRW